MPHAFAATPRRAAALVPFLLLACAGSLRAEDSAPTVEKCSRDLGTLAVAEPQDYVRSSLSRYGLGSPTAMLRLMVQESGCFTVVERGVAMQNLQQERALAAGGQLQAGSNIGGGQMQAADFVMTPAVQFSDDTGGVGGAIGGLLGRAGGVLGALGGLAGGVKFKEAQTTLLVADVRSGIQVAASEGNASKMNFSLGGWGWGGLGWASAGGYSKTPEGKLIAASLLDNYNKVVLAVRDKPALIRASSQASQQNAAQSIQATPHATAVATTRPAAPLPSPGGALPPGMVGAFSGQFSGADQGIFSVLVAGNGQISGVGQSAGNVSFQVSGFVNATGAVVMMSSGQAGTAQFAGIIDPANGTVTGTWRQSAGNGQGTFVGRKQ
jgi:hypothetical protein